MANEHTLMIETELPIPFTVANGNGIEKGTVLKNADPMTASASTGTEDIVAGIAAEEKIASDGKTTLAVYRRGIFKGTASGSIGVGDAIITAAGATANLVKTAAVNSEDILGISLETATDGQTFLYELGPRTNNLA